jgi:hypothetical protein
MVRKEGSMDTEKPSACENCGKFTHILFQVEADFPWIEKEWICDDCTEDDEYSDAVYSA